MFTLSVRVVVYAAVPLIAVVATHTTWAAAMGLDVWNLPSALDQAKTIEAEREAADTKKAVMFRQFEAADHVTARLATEAMTLREAVDELEPLLRDRTGFDYVWRHKYQEPTFQKGVARYAIIRASRILEGDPTRWAALSTRLEAEYAAIK